MAIHCATGPHFHASKKRRLSFLASPPLRIFTAPVLLEPMMNSSTLRERSNFSYSFALLPKKKRWAIHAIYDFCRRADDIVDEESGTVEDKQAKLASLRTEVEHCFQRKRT